MSSNLFLENLSLSSFLFSLQENRSELSIEGRACRLRVLSHRPLINKQIWITKPLLLLLIGKQKSSLPLINKQNIPITIPHLLPLLRIEIEVFSFLLSWVSLAERFLEARNRKVTEGGLLSRNMIQKLLTLCSAFINSAVTMLCPCDLSFVSPVHALHFLVFWLMRRFYNNEEILQCRQGGVVTQGRLSSGRRRKPEVIMGRVSHVHNLLFLR